MKSCFGGPDLEKEEYLYVVGVLYALLLGKGYVVPDLFSHESGNDSGGNV